VEKRGYEGFTTDPATWESALRKFQALAEPNIAQALRNQIADAVRNLEGMQIRRFTDLLGQVVGAGALETEGVQRGH
jgi:2-methylcitrate dehydratase